MQNKKDFFTSFLVKILSTIVIYGIMLIHFQYNNSDAIWTGTHYVGNNWELSLGRWAIRYFDLAQFGIHVHPWSSVITLCLFILGTMLLCEIFNIEYNTPADYAVSLTFLSNTVVSVSLSYLYTSHAYGGAFLFSILCMFAIKRATDFAGEKLINIKTIGFCILAILSMAFMLGLYQAYLGVVCIVALAYLIMFLGNKDLKYLKNYLVTGLSSGLIGLILYKIILEIELKRYQASMSDYHNANAWSLSAMLGNLGYARRETYNTFNSFLRNDYPKWTLLPYRLTAIILVVLALIVIAEVFFVKKNIVHTVVTAVAILLFPLAANIVMLLIPDSGMQIQQSAPMAMIFPCLLALAIKLKTPDMDVIQKSKKYLLITLSMLLVWGSSFQTVADQEALRQTAKAADSQVYAMISKLAALDLYNTNYRYAIVGSAITNPTSYKNSIVDMANTYTKMTNSRYNATDLVIWRGMLRNELGLELNLVTNEEYSSLLEMVDVQSMPVFPADGSIQVIDDVVVVRLSN